MLIERAIIGDESLALLGQRGFDHRMPPAGHREGRLIDHLWTTPVTFRRPLGERGADVDSRQCRSRCCDRLAPGKDFPDQRFEMRFLGGKRVRPRLGDASRFLVQAE